ncbi:MAG: Smr/MutS family protein, partial [Paracoccaceae bacterium]
QSTVPLHVQQKKAITEAVQNIGAAPGVVAIAPFELGEKSGVAPWPGGAAATQTGIYVNPPLRMDAKSFARMTKGKLKPERRLDLHGMTLAQAQPALTGFILRAHDDNKRLVLIITGKGKMRNDTGPVPGRIGVLRDQVPRWLSAAPLNTAVLQVSPAHLRHGGEGAFYVYLRRIR